MSTLSSITCGIFEVSLVGDSAGFRTTLAVHKGQDHVLFVRLTLVSERPAVPRQLSLQWSCPALDVQGMWHPAAERNRGLLPDWREGFTSRAAYSAPVLCLYGNRGNNVLCFACSDVLNPLQLQAGLHEETASFYCAVVLFGESCSPFTFFEMDLRLDPRVIPYYEALAGVAGWWAGLDGCEPSSVPEIAREPMYSTWYSFHQQLNPQALEAESRIAAELGCKAIIVDDGWQTTDETRGYAYCGDWKNSPAKIADMNAHIARIHELGLKYLLWYAVPFIGKYSEAWIMFRDKLLYYSESFGAGIADPRFPEVREYLTSIYEQAVREWDLDGFKLDFIDSFRAESGTPLSQGGGRDTDSLPEAIDLLLGGIMLRLRQLKPDIMIEFRQNYTGPLMRKYGNMFRAGDCPNDAVENRIRTLDIRLLCGTTAAHADMLMWNPMETAEHAALQFINGLFAVPQISVRLVSLPKAHLEMLSFWLSFWREHRDVLLDGRLEPHHPELLYPLLISRTPQKWVFAAYQDTVIPIIGDMPELVLVVNGTLMSRLVMEFDRDSGPYELKVNDCRGLVVTDIAAVWSKGVYAVDVPPAGVISIRRV